MQLDAVSFDCGGQRLHLLAQRAAWWPTEQTLLVADVHLGKGATFRALGQPLPRGASSADLARLSELIHTTGAQRLVVLGDFWHSRHGLSTALLAHLESWLAAHQELAITLVGGNHDRGIRPPLADPRLESLPSPLELAPGLSAHHHPPLALAGHEKQRLQPAAGDFALAGHLHPALRLTGTGRDQLRLPCFVWQPGQLILPAFGSLSGHLELDYPRLNRAGARLAVCAEQRIYLLPAAR